MKKDANEIQAKKSITEGAIKGSVAFIIEKAFPLLVPICAAATGIVQQLPWFHIIVGTSAVAAFTFHFLVQFNEWRFRTRVQDKLTFQSVLFANDSKGDGRVIGIQFINSATFQISWKVANLVTKLGTTVPEKEHVAKVFTIPPKGQGWFYDNGIKLSNPSTDSIPEGHIVGLIEFVVEYGKSQHLKYRMSGRKQVIVRYNKEGFLPQFTWNDLQ